MIGTKSLVIDTQWINKLRFHKNANEFLAMGLISNLFEIIE